MPTIITYGPCSPRPGAVAHVDIDEARAGDDYVIYEGSPERLLENALDIARGIEGRSEDGRRRREIRALLDDFDVQDAAVAALVAAGLREDLATRAVRTNALDVIQHAADDGWRAVVAERTQ